MIIIVMIIIIVLIVIITIIVIITVSIITITEIRRHRMTFGAVRVHSRWKTSRGP